MFPEAFKLFSDRFALSPTDLIGRLRPIDHGFDLYKQLTLLTGTGHFARECTQNGGGFGGGYGGGRGGGFGGNSSMTCKSSLGKLSNTFCSLQDIYSPL